MFLHCAPYDLENLAFERPNDPLHIVWLEIRKKVVKDPQSEK